MLNAKNWCSQPMTNPRFRNWGKTIHSLAKSWYFWTTSMLDHRWNKFCGTTQLPAWKCFQHPCKSAGTDFSWVLVKLQTSLTKWISKTILFLISNSTSAIQVKHHLLYIELYEPHLNCKAEGQGRKLSSFTNSILASLFNWKREGRMQSHFVSGGKIIQTEIFRLSHFLP